MMKHYNVCLPNYSIGVDCYKEIGYYSRYYGKKVVVIGGKTAMSKIKDALLEGIKDSKIEILDFIWYGGDSTYENGDLLISNETVKKADIIFLAIGKAKFLTKDMVKRNTIVIDIGINFDENNKLCGDADKQIYDYIRSYSPVPGGVGVLTNIMLMENLLLSYKMRHQNG